jgi:hypothetical protein
MAEGVYLRLTQVGPLPRSSILINDIEVGEGGMKFAGRGGFPRFGSVYVPSTGYVDLVFSSSVALSYESGAIAGFVTLGLITATFYVGLAFADAVLRNRGWANYDDTATTIVPAAALAGIWATIPCDGIGAQTDESFMPFISRFYDVPTQLVYLQDTRVGDYLTVRANVSIIPSVNNSRLQMRLWFPAFGGFALTSEEPRMDSGAGISYPVTSSFEFYIGSNDVRLGGAIPQINCGSDSTVRVEGILVHLH